MLLFSGTVKTTGRPQPGSVSPFYVQLVDQSAALLVLLLDRPKFPPSLRQTLLHRLDLSFLLLELLVPLDQLLLLPEQLEGRAGATETPSLVRATVSLFLCDLDSFISTKTSASALNPGRSLCQRHGGVSTADCHLKQVTIV